MIEQETIGPREELGETSRGPTRISWCLSLSDSRRHPRNPANSVTSTYLATSMDLATDLAREGPSVTHGHLLVPSATDTARPEAPFLGNSTITQCRAPVPSD